MPSTALDLQELPKSTLDNHPGPKDLSVEKMAELRDKGLSYQQVADIIGCHKSNVIRRLQHVGYDKDEVNHYKQYRADYLTFQQLRIDKYITNDKLKKSSAAQLVLMKCQLYDKERIERGLSTENIAYKDYTPQVTDLDNQIKALEAKIQGTETAQAPLQDDTNTTQDSVPIEQGDAIT